ncbi:hypothetical protein VRB21_20090 [Pseudomonas poae]
MPSYTGRIISLFSDNDSIVEPAASIELSRNLKAEQEVVSGGGHFLDREDLYSFQKYVRLLRGFLGTRHRFSRWRIHGTRTRYCYVSAKFTLQAGRYYQFMLTSGSGGTCTLYPSLIERDKDGTGWHLTPNSEVTYEGEGPTAKMHYNNSRFEDPDYHPPADLYPGIDVN